MRREKITIDIETIEIVESLMSMDIEVLQFMIEEYESVCEYIAFEKPNLTKYKNVMLPLLQAEFERRVEYGKN